MRSTLKVSIIAVGALILVVAAGYGLKSLFRKPAQAEALAQAQAQALNQLQMQQPTGPAGAFGQNGSVMPDMVNAAMGQAAVFTLMTKFGLDQEAANYFAQVKTQVVSQTDTSVHYIQTFPEGAKADTTVTLTPGQRYTPTPAERERTAQSAVPIYNVKFSTQDLGPNKVRITLQYFVPYSAVPPDVQQRLHLRASGAGFFALIPSVWADEGGGEGPGVAVASDTTMETFKEVAKQIIEQMAKAKDLEKLEKGPTVTYSFLYVLAGIKKYMEHSDWMNEINEMEGCAESNPLTRKAKYDPEHGNQAKEDLDHARSEIRQVSAVRGLNVATSLAASLVPGIFGTLMTPVSTWNDQSLKDVVEEPLQTPSNSVPACKKKPSMTGSFEYVYARKYDHHGVDGFLTREVNGTAAGEFGLNSGPKGWGILYGEGTATLAWTEHEKAKDKSYVYPTEQNGNLAGDLQVEVRGGGSPRTAQLKLSFGAKNLTYDLICTGCDSGKGSKLHHEAHFGRSCEFNNVDLVRGGKYSAPTVEDEGFGTCKIEIGGQ